MQYENSMQKVPVSTTSMAFYVHLDPNGKFRRKCDFSSLFLNRARSLSPHREQTEDCASNCILQYFRTSTDVSFVVRSLHLSTVIQEATSIFFKVLIKIWRPPSYVEIYYSNTLINSLYGADY